MIHNFGLHKRTISQENRNKSWFSLEKKSNAELEDLVKELSPKAKARLAICNRATAGLSVATVFSVAGKVLASYIPEIEPYADVTIQYLSFPLGLAAYGSFIWTVAPYISDSGDYHTDLSVAKDILKCRKSKNSTLP